MKVLSIKEPFATLVKNGDKLIETRSWKTNYRGELFIHASLKKIDKNFLSNSYINKLIQGLDMNYGNIICRCNLVDCVYMDEMYIDNIKKNIKEYNLGKFKLGRYAWILDNIEPIYPIQAKGKLNIWNYDGEYELIKKRLIFRK